MSKADYVWKVEPHICAACFGRVLAKTVEGGAREFRCSNCDATWTGQAKDGCCCGMKVGNRDAGIRCVENPSRPPELLSQIIAKEVG